MFELPLTDDHQKNKIRKLEFDISNRILRYCAQENRRNYDRLNHISSRFIMRNEKQEKKKLISKKRNNPNPINIVYYSLNPKSNKVLKLYSIILRIAKRNPKSRILLLGRNNNDINEFTNKG